MRMLTLITAALLFWGGEASACKWGEDCASGSGVGTEAFASLGSGSCPETEGQVCVVTDSEACDASDALETGDFPAVCIYTSEEGGSADWRPLALTKMTRSTSAPGGTCAAPYCIHVLTTAGGDTETIYVAVAGEAFTDVGNAQEHARCMYGTLAAAPGDNQCLLDAAIGACSGETVRMPVHNIASFDEFEIAVGDTVGAEDTGTDDWRFGVAYCADGQNATDPEANCTVIGTITNAEWFAAVSSPTGADQDFITEDYSGVAAPAAGVGTMVIFYDEDTDGGTGFDPDMSARFCWFESR